MNSDLGFNFFFIKSLQIFNIQLLLYTYFKTCKRLLNSAFVAAM